MKKQIVLIALFAIAGAVSAQMIAGTVLAARNNWLALCVEDENTALELAEEGGLVVLASSSRDRIQHVRETAFERGFLNKTLYAYEAKPSELPLADHYADMVFLGEGITVSKDELTRVLRPGGVAYNRGSEEPFMIGPPLVDTDEYTHWFHGPDNNPVSSDQVVKWPFATQWVDLPYRGPQPCINLVAGGYFYSLSGYTYQPIFGMEVMQEVYANQLSVRNAYNGLVLWKRNLPESYPVAQSLAVAEADELFLLETNKLLILSAEDGAEKKSVDLPDHGKWMVKVDDQLLMMVGASDEKALKRPKKRPKYLASSADSAGELLWGRGHTIVSYDLKENHIAWRYHSEPEHLDARLASVRDGRLYLVTGEGTARALDLTTGKIIWENNTPEFREAFAAMQSGRNHALQSTRPGILPTPDVVLINTKYKKNVLCLAAENGQLLWIKEAHCAPVHTFWDETTQRLYLGTKGPGYVEPRTGERTERGPSAGQGCGTPVLAPSGVFGRQGMVYDTLRKKEVLDHSNRSGCWQNCFPALGQVYYAPYTCSCNYSLRGAMAVAPVDISFPGTPPDTVSSGEAQAGQLMANDLDWDTYRADVSRSASTAVHIKEPPVISWVVEALGETLTPPIAVKDQIFFGDQSGTVRCVLATNGQTQWTFHTGGKIYAPPTFSDGIIYVGSGDGWIYALNADNGRRVWSFKAAPGNRSIYLYGQLSSAWPVTTGILVHQGVAYAAAGILDRDGTFVYALNAKTGQPIWTNGDSGHADPDSRKGASAMGNLTISKDTLWLAGGNGCSPAGYDLQTGAFTVPGYFSRNVYHPVPRGKHIGVLQDRFILHGGTPLFADQREWMNGAHKGGACTLAEIMDGAHTVKFPEWAFSTSGTMPAWNNQTLIVHSRGKKKSKVESWDVAKIITEVSPDIQAQADALWPAKRPIKAFFGLPKNAQFSTNYTMKLWQTVESPTFIRSIVLTQKSVLVAHAKIVQRTAVTSPTSNDFHLVAFDRETGKKRWEIPLPGDPIENSICVNRNGQIFLTTLGGSLVCLQ